MYGTQQSSNMSNTNSNSNSSSVSTTNISDLPMKNGVGGVGGGGMSMNQDMSQGQLSQNIPNHSFNQMNGQIGSQGTTYSPNINLNQQQQQPQQQVNLQPQQQQQQVHQQNPGQSIGMNHTYNQGQNVSFHVEDKQGIPNNQMQSILNSIQHSNGSNMNIPSRDIPMMQTSYASDIQTQPNYVPNNYQGEEHKRDKFIEREREKEDYIQNIKFDKDVENVSLLHKLIDKIHVPIFFGSLFFLINTPFFNSKMYGMFPGLFLKETKLSLQGHLFKSIVFGILSLSSYQLMEELK